MQDGGLLMTQKNAKVHGGGKLLWIKLKTCGALSLRVWDEVGGENASLFLSLTYSAGEWSCLIMQQNFNVPSTQSGAHWRVSARAIKMRNNFISAAIGMALRQTKQNGGAEWGLELIDWLMSIGVILQAEQSDSLRLKMFSVFFFDRYLR